MSPDSFFIILTSLGFAAVFLALVIAMANKDAEQIVTAMIHISPSAKRRAQLERLTMMTRLADEAISARKMDKQLLVKRAE
jgi:hypothetical protein